MKRSLIASALALTLTVASAASAESSLFATPNASAEVAFYTADPSDGGAILTTASVNNSPVAMTIGGISAAHYAVITYGGEAYTFALTESGANKNDVVLETATPTGSARLVSDSGKVTLADLLNGLATDPTLLEPFQSTAPLS